MVLPGASVCLPSRPHGPLCCRVLWLAVALCCPVLCPVVLCFCVVLCCGALVFFLLHWWCWFAFAPSVYLCNNESTGFSFLKINKNYTKRHTRASNKASNTFLIYM